ncbi:MAG: flagellar hook assembly protein FlgD [Shewanella oncorhynchi]
MSLINQINQASAQTAQAKSQTNVATNSVTSSTGNPYLDGVRMPKDLKVPEAKGQQLTQEDFFALLSQQLSMQDPFKPVDNDQMIAQMASFSTVDGISNLNKEIVNLNSIMTSSQALQASGLVGRKVLIPSGTGHVSTESPTMKGVITTPKIPELTVRVEDEKGQVITTFKVDGSEGGNVDVNWDGLDKDGKPVAAGNYTIKASGIVDGKSQELPVSTYAHVTSVSLGTASTGAILNLRGGMGIKLSDVLAVSET